MLIDHGSEIEYMTRDFDKKMLKKLKIESLINLNNKLRDLESDNVEKSLVELKRILRNILDKEPKQHRIYRKELEVLKKTVVDEFGYHQKGSIIEKYVGLGIIFGVAIGAGLSSVNVTFSGLGIALGLAIGSGIGTKMEKEEEEKGNIY